uniref:Putative secreted protein n=1 Tax=Anopheles darlingi TaxID=43151 RepID=A0A2M4DMX7_ANODA
MCDLSSVTHLTIVFFSFFFRFVFSFFTIATTIFPVDHPLPSTPPNNNNNIRGDRCSKKKSLATAAV